MNFSLYHIFMALDIFKCYVGSPDVVVPIISLPVGLCTTIAEKECDILHGKHSVPGQNNCVVIFARHKINRLELYHYKCT